MLCDTYLKFTKDNYTLKVLGKQPKGEIFMKNWDVTLAQIPLVAIGAWYVYQAVLLFDYNRTNFQPQSSFIWTITIGIVLLGMALGLHEVRRYRANKQTPFFGAGQIVKEIPVVHCEECKELIPEASSFCPHCGAKRKDDR